MLASGAPPKFPVPWASGAAPANIRPIPTADPGTPGFASLTLGFPPDTMVPVASGGVPPFGQDANGILKQVTLQSQWNQAGGPAVWDAAFSAAVTGYPRGAVVASATTFGLSYLCLVDANVTNPDTGGAGWQAFPTAGNSLLYGGALFGLTVSNTPSAPTTGITVSVGSCRDVTNTYAINNTSPCDKRLTGSWVAGSGNGGKLSATALANGQTWFVYALLNPTTGAVDFGYDQSPTTPTMTLPNAAGFTNWRRLRGILLEAASTSIRQFIQIGDWTWLTLPSPDYAAQSNGGLIPYYRAVSVPVGIVVEAAFIFQSTGAVDDNPYLSGIYNPAFGAPPAFGPSTQWAQIRRLGFKLPSGTSVAYGYTECTQFTDASAHVYTRSSDNVDVIAIKTLGWRDQAGQFYPDP